MILTVQYWSIIKWFFIKKRAWSCGSRLSFEVFYIKEFLKKIKITILGQTGL